MLSARLQLLLKRANRTICRRSCSPTIVRTTPHISCRQHSYTHFRRHFATQTVISTTFQPSQSQCWSCNKVVQGNICQFDSCGALLYAPDLSYLTADVEEGINSDDKTLQQQQQQEENVLAFFALFEIEPSYDIDTKILEQRYRKLQLQLHPDKFSLKSPQEKANSEAWTALVNEAYDVLRKPYRRAVYLCKVYDMTYNQESDSTDDIELIEHFFDMREVIEDPGSSLETLQQLKDTLLQEQAATEAALSAEFDPEVKPELSAETVHQHIRKLSYQGKTLHELEKKLPSS